MTVVIIHAVFVAGMLNKIQLNVLCVRNGCTRCSGVKGKLKKNQNFQCPVCTGRVANRTVEDKVLLLDGAGQLDCVDRFCYLGDVIGDGGGAEEATRARVKCAWSKFKELAPILTTRGASLKLKGKIYRACVQRVMVYGSETWAA